MIVGGETIEEAFWLARNVMAGIEKQVGDTVKLHWLLTFCIKVERFVKCGRFGESRAGDKTKSFHNSMLLSFVLKAYSSVNVPPRAG